MTLVVEDGSVVASANSYLSIADADAYHDARANAAWAAAATADKTSALIRSADFMTQRYRRRWKGVRKDSTQRLDWPRAGVITERVLDTTDYVLPELDQLTSYLVPNNVVPEDVKEAQAELALRALTDSTLNPDLTRCDDVMEERVDVISTKYKPTARTGTTFQAVDDVLYVYLMPRLGVQLQRA